MGTKIFWEELFLIFRPVVWGGGVKMYHLLFYWETSLAVWQLCHFYFTEEQYHVCFSDSSDISTVFYDVMNYLARSLLTEKICIALILDVLLLVNPNSLSYLFINSYSCKNLPCFWLYFPLLLFFTMVSHGLCLAGALTCELDSTLQRITVLKNAEERRSRQSNTIFSLQYLSMYYVFRKLKLAKIFYGLKMEYYLNHTKHLHTILFSSVLLTKSKRFTIIS